MAQHQQQKVPTPRRTRSEPRQRRQRRLFAVVSIVALVSVVQSVESFCLFPQHGPIASLTIQDGTVSKTLTRWTIKSKGVCSSERSKHTVQQSQTDRHFCQASPRVGSVGLSLATVGSVSMSMSDGGTDLLRAAESLGHDAIQKANRQDFDSSIDSIRRIYALVTDVSTNADVQTTEPCIVGRLSQIVGETLAVCTNLAFANRNKQTPTARRSHTRKDQLDSSRVFYGLAVLNMHLRSLSQLSRPFDTVARADIMDALWALSSVIQSKSTDFVATRTASQHAFRLVQRLVSGYQVRHSRLMTNREFHMVLNALCTVGEMDLAHRVVGLHERSEGASPLTAVTYSILLKGYGRLQDQNGVRTLLSHAHKNRVEPDIVMVNSALDALINCGAMETARATFQYVSDPNGMIERAPGFLLHTNQRLQPNSRTFNTFLKGLGKTGSIEEATLISQDMEARGLWDDVTTNTLVGVAVAGKNLTLAEAILSKHTAAPVGLDRKPHPNVEAYTELLSGYAKARDMESAQNVLRTMKNRGVPPNEITLTTLVAGLATVRRTRQAAAVVRGMVEAPHMRTTAITMNALLSGVLNAGRDRSLMQSQHSGDMTQSVNTSVDDAIKMFKWMSRQGILPNETTLLILVEALGSHSPPRVDEAVAWINKFRNERVFSTPSVKVQTALLRAFAEAGKYDDAKACFAAMKSPDAVAVNAYIDTCGRCGDEKGAFSAFGTYFRGDSKLRPDVVSYSVLFTLLFRKQQVFATRKAQRLYATMRSEELEPDQLMIDQYVLLLLLLSFCFASSFMWFSICFVNAHLVNHLLLGVVPNEP